MSYGRVFAVAIGMVVVLGMYLAPAQAQSTRTFVSGNGTDVGGCGRSAPCRTFAYAITQTNAGGEIAVLDTAGYGSVNIDKAISIVNPGGVEAGITATSLSYAIRIAAGPNDTVSLRGLTVDGAGIGSWGILLVGGGGLELIDTTIRGFTGGNSGIGINVDTATPFSLVMSNSYILSNDYGIILGSNHPGAWAVCTLSRVTIANNIDTGFAAGSADANANETFEMLISDSHIDNNGQTGIDLIGYTGSVMNLVLLNTTINQTPTAISLRGYTNLWLSHVTQTAVPGFSNTGIALSGTNNNVASDGTSHLNSGSLSPWYFQ